MENLAQRCLKARKEYLLTTFEAMLSNQSVKTLWGQDITPELSSEELWEVVTYYIRDNNPDFYVEKRDEKGNLAQNIHYLKLDENEIAQVIMKAGKSTGEVSKISRQEFDEIIEGSLQEHNDIGFNNTRGEYKDLSYVETIKDEDDNEVVMYNGIFKENKKSSVEVISYVNSFFDSIEPVLSCKNDDRDEK